jgi:hypothetical protein
VCVSDWVSPGERRWQDSGLSGQGVRSVLPNSDIICVLGSARSGTSVTTRVPSLLGVSLGPTTTLHQEWGFNEAGSWEHSKIWEIERRIMTELVRPSWMRRLPPLPDDWVNSLSRTGGPSPLGYSIMGL